MAGTPTVSVLLGAGASVDAGIPTSVAMTDAVISRIVNREQVAMLEFVRHTIAANLAQQHDSSSWRASPVDVAVDVERFFASVELLADRYGQAWSPFVATWHPGLERFAPRSSSSDFHRSSSLARAIGGIVDHGGTRRLADELIKLVDDAIERAQGRDVSEVLAKARTELLRSLFDVLHIEDPSRTKYLSPLVELAQSQGSLTVGTLNYDRSVENVAELEGVECDTGIETWLESGALDWPTSGLRLLKLHGSIDWVFERKQDYHELPLQRIRKVIGADEKARYDAPAVVFGEAGKLRAEGPFIELLLAWSTQLQQADNLLVVGYSFRDTHVNEVIARWFNAGPTRGIIVLDPADLDSGSRDSLPSRLMDVDRRFPNEPPVEVPRVRHIAATTRDSLGKAIEAALVPVSSPVAGQATGPSGSEVRAAGTGA